MALCSKVKVPLPDAGVTVRRSGRYATVYKVLKAYRNEKGQPTCARVSIGRLDAASGMLVPNDNYWEHYGAGTVEVLPAYDSVRSVGASFLLGRVLDTLGIKRALADCLGPERGRLALTAVLYMACRGNVFEHVLAFCEGFTLSEQPLSSQGASALFSSVTHGERMAFFKDWASRQEAGSYLAYDVTSFSTYAEGIADAEWGHNRDGERLSQVNLGCYLSQATGLPVFYVTYPGSVVDKSHLSYMMAYNEELGIKDVGFVMDRGFCSTANVGYMTGASLDFVVGAVSWHKQVRRAIGSVAGSITSMRNHIGCGVYARSVTGTFYGAEAVMHVFFDPGASERQRRDLFCTVESAECRLFQTARLTGREAKRYRAYFDIRLAGDGTFTFERDYGKIDAVAARSGFFCILTNTPMTSAEVLAVYRKRDMLEKGFDDLKNHIDMRRMRTHTTATTDGKLFLAFVALIAVSEVHARLGAVMRERSWSKDAVIAELEKIKVVTASGGRRLMSPVTRTQRLILEAFGLTEDDLTAYVTGAPGT